MRYLFYFIISYLIITAIHFVSLFKKSNTHVSGKSFDYMPSESINTINYKVNFIEELELNILYRSGIKKIFPFMSLNIFLIFILFVAVVSFVLFYAWIKLVIPSLILSGVISVAPIIILNIMEQRKNDLVSKELARFISIISRWSIIKDDIFYCFEKAIDQVSDPIKSYISDFLMNVKYTGNISYAFDILLIQSKNELYRNFIINIRQAEQSKGDLPVLLDYLEEEVYKIEAENSRRKSVTLKDRTIIYFTMVCVLLIGVFIFKFNINIRTFYMSSIMGRYLLTVYLILFFLGIYVTSKITSFNY